MPAAQLSTACTACAQCAQCRICNCSSLRHEQRRRCTLLWQAACPRRCTSGGASAGIVLLKLPSKTRQPSAPSSAVLCRTLAVLWPPRGLSVNVANADAACGAAKLNSSSSKVCSTPGSENAACGRNNVTSASRCARDTSSDNILLLTYVPRLCGHARLWMQQRAYAPQLVERSLPAAPSQCTCTHVASAVLLHGKCTVLQVLAGLDQEALCQALCHACLNFARRLMVLSMDRTAVCSMMLEQSRSCDHDHFRRVNFHWGKSLACSCLCSISGLYPDADAV